MAAGKGARLRPLTELLPKPLCPVANIALIDHAFARVDGLDVAVNVSYMGDLLAEHVGERAFVSHETEPALGTAGALGKLRDWIDGRGVLVQNSDAWHEADLGKFAKGWSGDSVRLLAQRSTTPDFGSWMFCGASLMPWHLVKELQPVPTGLWEVSWRELWQAGEIELFEYGGRFVDCGTPSDYLHANLMAAGTDNVVSETAVVEGTIEGCVIWPGSRVERGEHLVSVIRATNGLTVQC